ncbi:hypothetical protein ACFWOS_32695 [Streptomyces rubiginosohelvolus]|uniref:hypothetical protein n=1 Tax=Streptomyces TaxID=1883 RepID=UPI000BF13942|nr:MULTISPECIES: hypothetical protein [unclassified Streptomyces]MBK3529206.1 hypothetical protein [Streptomyces sp. MBT72]MBK3535577.1 hypothetical protein [Streptomyces sp. MBT67]MBK3549499.1 hypothetical protein [Streptomyces sp. MBT61]MBK6028326.1 hypothetical protein [Streptomyces sp. MBT59]
MFRRRARADRAFREAQRAGQAMLAMYAQQPWPADPGLVAAAVPATPDAAVELDFLPPDFRAPSRKEVEGFMMRWDSPLVIDGEVRQCPSCGAYRNWIIFNLRDDSVWLRCRAGHETKETGLDTAWYNRNSGPAERWHPTLEDGLRHLGH